MSAGTVEVRFLICPRSPSLAIGHDTRVQVLSPKVLDSRFHTRAPVATMLRSATFSVLVDILETVVSASSECWRIWLGGERLSAVLFSPVAGLGKGPDRVHRLSLVATATCFKALSVSKRTKFVSLFSRHHLSIGGFYWVIWDKKTASRFDWLVW